MKNEWVKAYEMNLGDEEYVEMSFSISKSLIRVPGGWVMNYHSYNNMTSTFIPFNNEFQTTKKPC